ncbi:hypothetical protein THS27_21590 [Thalassospira sp. MCCC 1A01428]|nr:hypothetical protein THS27_21590 [Thalassospira sp. MCCC 1A01428]
MLNWSLKDVLWIRNFRYLISFKLETDRAFMQKTIRTFIRTGLALIASLALIEIDQGNRIAIYALVTLVICECWALVMAVLKLKTLGSAMKRKGRLSFVIEVTRRDPVPLKRENHK